MNIFSNFRRLLLWGLAVGLLLVVVGSFVDYGAYGFGVVTTTGFEFVSIAGACFVLSLLAVENKKPILGLNSYLSRVGLNLIGYVFGGLFVAASLSGITYLFGSDIDALQPYVGATSLFVLSLAITVPLTKWRNKRSPKFDTIENIFFCLLLFNCIGTLIASDFDKDTAAYCWYLFVLLFAIKSLSFSARSVVMDDVVGFLLAGVIGLFILSIAVISYPPLIFFDYILPFNMNFVYGSIPTVIIFAAHYYPWKKWSDEK